MVVAGAADAPNAKPDPAVVVAAPDPPPKLNPEDWEVAALAWLKENGEAAAVVVAADWPKLKVLAAGAVVLAAPKLNCEAPL